MFDICERAKARLAGMAHIAALVLALAGLPELASAQPLTLRQALTLARDSDVGLAASEARIEAPRARFARPAFRPIRPSASRSRISRARI